MRGSAVAGGALAVVVALFLLGCGGEGPAEDAGAGLPVEPGAVFVEVSEQTGLEFSHYIGTTGQRYLAEIMGPGVAVLDYDNDGDLDVYFPQGKVLEPGKTDADAIYPPPKEHFPNNRLFRNEIVPTGRLRFTDVTEEAGVGDSGFGEGVAVGDYNNDGFQDIYVTNFGENVLYRNNGDGTFTDVSKQAGVPGGLFSTSAAFVDFNNDGNLDLFVVQYNAFTIAGNKVCKAASAEEDYCGPTAYFPAPDTVYLNEGNGHFRDVTRETGVVNSFGHGLSVITADFDNDGRIDIYVGNDVTPNQLWMYRANGKFEDMGLMSGCAYNEEGNAEASMGVSAEDFDGDGDIDIFLAHIQHETHTLYLNDGHGNFFDNTAIYGLAHASRGITGFGTSWLDYDNDGLLDIFVNTGLVMMDGGSFGEDFPYKQKNQLFHNEGGKFKEVSAQSGSAFQLREVGRGAAFGDIDNDGDIDVVAVNCNGPARLFLNQVGNRNHWLSYRLEGVNVNRCAYGAKAALLRKGRKPVWRRVSADGSYYSANDPRVHFGLGGDAALAAAPPEAVVVVWPDHTTERWSIDKVDRESRLKQGTGTPAKLP